METSFDECVGDLRRKHLISPMKYESHWLLRFVRSRKFLLMLIVVLGMFAMVCFVLLLIVNARNERLAEDAEFLNRNIDWRNNCEKQCKISLDVPPLLLISMDGFRADYFQHDLTPAVSRILECGTHADYMIPSFPSKTFPNHYSIVTGLYPEAHGIVDNMFMDPDMENSFFSKRTNDSRWYKGEPIWNTATKNNRKSATFFWPGSEVPIQGLQPTYLNLYDKSTPFSKRVDQVISWLELGDADMPYFLAMYFEQPDAACHTEGPNSDLVKSGLIYVDAMINYLMYRLDRKGLLGCLNIVIVSDHGGQEMHPEKFLAVGDYVDVTDSNLEVFSGTVGHLNFHNLSTVNVPKVIEPFACRLNHSFRVYSKDTVPLRYHYANNRRIGPVLFDGYLGARVFKSQKELQVFKDRGDHGYDNRNRQMRAIFGAYGPDIRPKTQIEPFQNIELYNLFTDLMRLPFTAENNGSRGALYPVLRNPPNYVDTGTIELASCGAAEIIKCGDGCYFKLKFIKEEADESASPTIAATVSSAFKSSSDSTERKSARTPNCQRLTWLEAPRELATLLDLCQLQFCNASMAYSRVEGRMYFVESVLSLSVANIDHRANCGAIVQFSNDGTTQATFHSTVSMESIGHQSTEPWTKPMIRFQPNNQQKSDDQINLHTMDKTKKTNIPPQAKPKLAEKPTINSNSKPVITAWGLSETNLQHRRRSDRTTAATRLPWLRADQSNHNASQYQTVCKNLKWSASPWISLFPDNDYTRYVFQGQIRVPSGFYNGPWKHLLELILKYQRHYQKMLMYAGPIFDANNDGLADAVKEIQSEDGGGGVRQPSHVFVMLMRCGGGVWRDDYRACQNVSETATLTFILPIVEKDDNCLFLEEYLFLNTARIRDVELLTNYEWFTNRKIYSPAAALRLRIELPQQLWQLERGVT